MTVPTKNLQFFRSFTPGNKPSRLKAGEIAFNVPDKLMFVGDGTSYFTDKDATQTASTFALEGWFEADLDAYAQIQAVSAAVTDAQSDATDALTRIGSSMNSLNTSDQQTLIGAINEVLAAAEAAQSTADSAASDASTGLSTKLDKPDNQTTKTEGQVLHVGAGGVVSWSQLEASEVNYVDNANLGTNSLQVAVDFALSTNVTQAGDISAAAADAQTAIGLANTAQGTADSAVSDAAAAQGTADTALTAAQNAQGDADALDTRLTAAEGDISTLQSDVSGLQSSKQDDLGSGTEGQFLRYVSGSPTWSSFDPKLGSVATTANVAAFEAIQAAADEGDVAVIVDAIGLAPSGTGYSIGNLASAITENFSISLIKDAAGAWLVLATPGSLTQVAADALYASRTTSVSAGTGLTGGGDLSTNRTLSIADNGVTYDLIQQSSQKALIGAGAAGDLGEITLGDNLDIVAGVLEVSFDFGTF